MGRPGVSLGRDIGSGMKPAENPASSLPQPRRPEGAVQAAANPQTLPQGVAAPVRLIWESLIPITLQDSAFRLVDVNRPTFGLPASRATS